MLPAARLPTADLPEMRKPSILLEILQERSVSSRGRRIPRGLKRKMSGYPLRHARAPTQVQLHLPVISAPSFK